MALCLDTSLASSSGARWCSGRPPVVHGLRSSALPATGGTPPRRPPSWCGTLCGKLVACNRARRNLAINNALAPGARPGEQPSPARSIASAVCCGARTSNVLDKHKFSPCFLMMSRHALWSGAYSPSEPPQSSRAAVASGGDSIKIIVTPATFWAAASLSPMMGGSPSDFTIAPWWPCAPTNASA